MTKPTETQKRVVGRVMGAFKRGDLESGSGDTVTDRRQAVAIALGEAGASNRQSPKQNRKRLRRTLARERNGAPSKAELYAEARRKDVPGRSKMTKAQLERALRD